MPSIRTLDLNHLDIVVVLHIFDSSFSLRPIIALYIEAAPVIPTFHAPSIDEGGEGKTEKLSPQDLLDRIDARACRAVIHDAPWVCRSGLKRWVVDALLSEVAALHPGYSVATWDSRMEEGKRVARERICILRSTYEVCCSAMIQVYGEMLVHRGAVELKYQAVCV
jgi:hypothetical protein